jgi:hypothetical protein
VFPIKVIRLLENEKIKKLYFDNFITNKKGDFMVGMPTHLLDFRGFSYLLMNSELKLTRFYRGNKTFRFNLIMQKQYRGLKENSLFFH